MQPYYFIKKYEKPEFYIYTLNINLLIYFNPNYQKLKIS